MPFLELSYKKAFYLICSEVPGRVAVRNVVILFIFCDVVMAGSRRRREQGLRRLLKQKSNLILKKIIKFCFS